MNIIKQCEGKPFPMQMLLPATLRNHSLDFLT